MKTQPVVSAKSASFDGATTWHSLDWDTLQISVRKTQLKIAQATGEGNWRKVKRLQRMLTHSFYGRCLAVRRVTENRGRKTPGVDGETWGTPKTKIHAVMRLAKKRGYRPSPLKRVWIPKPGRKEQRPLGIPTMLDRAMQALFLLALEPVIESTSDPKSYGFRPDRSSTDAMVELHKLLSREVAPVWILEGDIKGFFDNINHDWLGHHVPMDKVILRKWLSAGVIDRGQFAVTKAGTPQGGIISPCLANATLNGLETLLKDHLVDQLGVKKTRTSKVNVVRYADDFVITGASKELLEQVVKPWVEQFLAARGVELSQEKTHITHIHEGFDFLGWNFRKYLHRSPRRKPTLLIKPSKKNAAAFYQKVKKIISNSGALTQEELIGQLNPVLRGWANYHSPVVAKQTFSKLDHDIFWRLWRWAKHRHSRKPAKWIKKKYFSSISGRNWVFMSPYKNSKGEVKHRRLYTLADTAIVRHKRLPGDYHPYDAKHEMKWEQLRIQRMKHKLPFRRNIVTLFNRQGGKCSRCGHAITAETGWHDHHVIRRVDGGSDSLSNRTLLHPNCHALVHSQEPRTASLGPIVVKSRAISCVAGRDDRLL